MKITNRKSIDAKLMTGINVLQRQFGCKIYKVYVFNVELVDGKVGALVGYFNKRTNEIYINISNKLYNEEIANIGAVMISEGQFGIQADIIEGEKEVIDTYRVVIDELDLEIYHKEHKKD